jgi:hypothetical protein
MDLITFRCSSCNRGLKIPADKAGRKVKCTKCGTSLTVPAKSEPTPAASPSKSFVEEDEVGIYTIQDAESIAAAKKAEEEEIAKRQRIKRREEEEAAEYDLDEEEQKEADEELRRRLSGEELEDEDYEDEYEEDEDRPKKKRQPRAKLDAGALQKIRVGCMVAVIAISCLLGSVLFHKITILIGLTSGQHYAESLQEIHPHYQGSLDADVDTMQLALTLVGGRKAYSANKVLWIISHLLVLFQGIVMVVACVFCLSTAERYGAKGLVISALVLAGVNLVVALIFRFLPVVGAMKFMLLPLFGGEMGMSASNVDRSLPLHLFWTDNQYIQVLLTIFVLVLGLGELVLFPLFLRAIALQMKAEDLENSCLSLVQLSLAQVFIQVSYQVMAMTGTTDVLRIVLMFLYYLGLSFFIWQLVWYIIILFRARQVIQDALDKEYE